MYHGLDNQGMEFLPFEQRKYMRDERQRNINWFAVTTKRSDMIVPVEELHY